MNDLPPSHERPPSARLKTPNALHYADLFGGDIPPTREVKVDFDVGGGGEPARRA